MVTTRSQNRRQVPGREPVKKPAPVARAKPAPTTRPKATKPTAKKAAKTPTTRRNNGVTRSGRPAAGQKTNCRQKHSIVDLHLPEGSQFIYEKEKCNVRKLRSRVKIDQYNLSPAFTILLHGKEEGHIFYKGDPTNIIEDQRALDAPRRCTFDDCSSNRIICQLGFTFEKFEDSLPEPSDMKQMGVFIQGKNHVALYMLLPLDDADGNSSSNEEQQGQQQQQQHEQQQQQHEQQQQQHEQQQQQHEQQQQQHEQQQQQQHQQQQERQQQQPQQQQGNQQQQQQPKDTSSASLKRKFTLRSVETLSKRVRIVRSAQHNSDDAVHEEQMQETPDNAENHEDSVEHATEEDNESSPDEIPCTPNTKDKDTVNRTSTPVIPSTSKGFRGKPVNFMRTGRLSPIDNRKRDEDEDNESISSMSIFEASMSTNASADYLKTLFHEYLADEIEARRFFALAKVVRDNPPWVTLKKSYPPIAQYYNHLRVIGHALYLYPELPRVPPTLHGLVEKEAAERILQKCIAVWELRPALTKAEERKKISRFNSLFKKVFPEGDRNFFLKTGYPYPDKDQREKKSGKQLYDCFSAILGKTDGGVETKEKM